MILNLYLTSEWSQSKSDFVVAAYALKLNYNLNSSDECDSNHVLSNTERLTLPALTEINHGFIVVKV